MENNEITMFMEVKLDIHNKRPDSLKFKQWSKCEVKIEGIKCLPSYLRVTITGCTNDGLDKTELQSSDEKRCICVSIIVPGVNISLAASRTKEFSYGLFWTQYRKPCYIYFALETETSCRRHMKWIKKTIKNLELHRQLMLEHNRISRGPSMGVVDEAKSSAEKENVQKAEDEGKKSSYSELGPLPKIPSSHDCIQNNSASQRVSHISDIYEEIIEYVGGQPRLSRRVSRASIASGIYEEMKPCNNDFNAIDEESNDLPGIAISATSPPPLPPIPPQRKRINTFDGQGALGEIPRSNTNPESELAKKKKYKNVLDIIFGNGRAKRAESVSETQACTAEDIINSITPTKPSRENDVGTPIYSNDTVAIEQVKPKCVTDALANLKRNSFSSPDLSKINYLDDGAALSSSDDLNLSDDSLHNACLVTSKDAGQSSSLFGKIVADGLNISEKLPNNFNFSAINSSGINLIGFKGAAIPSSNHRKNKILIDDLSGYCVMAPIRPKKIEQTPTEKTPTEPLSSGYSTGSYPSTSSSTADEPKAINKIEATAVNATPTAATNVEESAIYEQMLSFRTSNVESDNETSKITRQAEDSPKILAYTAASVSTSSNIADFTGNLYENLLAVKASQELEQQLPTASLSTSTPTESPLTQPTVSNDKQIVDEEEYYQTPRKSIISVDEKIPSYYPNSCDTMKTRRHHTLATASPQQKVYNTSPIGAAATITNEKCNSTATSVGLRHLVNLKIRRERKENLYISSPQCIIDQRQNAGNHASEFKSKISQKNAKAQSIRAGALKIAEHVYTVKHAAKQKNLNDEKNLNNNNESDDGNVKEDMRERLQTELLHFALLQKIDFKFDDASSAAAVNHQNLECLKTPSPTGRREQQQIATKERIYENLLQQHLELQKTEQPIDDGSESCSMNTPAAIKMTADNKLGMHQSCIAGMRNSEADATTDADVVIDSCSTVTLASGLSNVKKFASLPRFKKIDFSPLRLKINNVLQRGQQQDF